MVEKKATNKIAEMAEAGKAPAHYVKGLTNVQRSDKVRAKLKGAAKGEPVSERERQNLQMQSINLRSEFAIAPKGQTNVEKKNDKQIRFHQEAGAPFPLREGRHWRPQHK